MKDTNDTAARAAQISTRRRRDPVRESRRQAHLTRMLRRVSDFVPTYRDTLRGHEITASTYTGHVALYER